MDKLLVTIIAVFLIGGGMYFIFQNQKPTPIPVAQINSFEECVAAGNAVMESYPRQCNTADGKHFVENIGNANEMSNLIVVDYPRPNETAKSPLTITGKARGTWYFEGSFPIEIAQDPESPTIDPLSFYNLNTLTVGTGIAKAKGEWMTEDLVPFEARVEFANPVYSKGFIILKKDNPSGLPANDKQLIIPIKF